MGENTKDKRQTRIARISTNGKILGSATLHVGQVYARQKNRRVKITI
jgi:hypothetical protein